MAVTTEVAADGLRFIATRSGKTYRSLNIHRSAGWRSKSLWRDTVTREDEFALFDMADGLDWHDCRGYWSFHEQTSRLLGTRDERMAHFPDKSDGADDWHGFPIHVTVVRRPAKALVEHWAAEGHITFAVASKLKRGKL